MNVGRAFTFIREDERWVQKLGIGTAVILISFLLTVLVVGIAGFIIVAGYCVRLLQNVRDDHPRPLPEWDRWGEDLVTGFKLCVVFFIYALPALVVMIPLSLGSIVMNQGDAAAMAGFSLILCASCLVIIYAIALTLALPGIMVAFARDGSISSALDLRHIYEWTRLRIGPVLVAIAVVWLVQAVAAPIAMVAGTILCLVGLLVTIPLAVLVPLLIQSHLFGQLAREAAGSPVHFATTPPPAQPPEQAVG